MAKKKMVVLIVIMALFVLFVYWFKGYMEIDKCLDSGGSWNYDKEICKYQEIKLNKEHKEWGSGLEISFLAC